MEFWGKSFSLSASLSSLPSRSRDCSKSVKIPNLNLMARIFHWPRISMDMLDEDDDSDDEDADESSDEEEEATPKK
ncbi:hypothetical protein B296_00051712, partial [Ensete ventricosum]